MFFIPIRYVAGGNTDCLVYLEGGNIDCSLERAFGRVSVLGFGSLEP